MAVEPFVSKRRTHRGKRKKKRRKGCVQHDNSPVGSVVVASSTINPTTLSIGYQPGAKPGSVIGGSGGGKRQC